MTNLSLVWKIQSVFSKKDYTVKKNVFASTSCYYLLYCLTLFLFLFLSTYPHLFFLPFLFPLSFFLIQFHLPIWFYNFYFIFNSFLNMFLIFFYICFCKYEIYFPAILSSNSPISFFTSIIVFLFLSLFFSYYSHSSILQIFTKWC